AVPSGETVWYLHSQFQVEIEYGLGKNFELGLYLTFTPSPGEGYSQTVTTFPEGNGMKQRIRWAAADPGELPVDLNLYGEIVENQRAIELEAKVILQRRFGAMRLVANLTGEYELYYDSRRDIEIEASAGATVELSPAFHLGVEAWSHTEYPTNPAPDVRPF